MVGRRFSLEQQEGIAKVREKQKRACARKNHHWWPDYGWDEESRGRPVEPKYWTVQERFPMPAWDGKSIICSAHKCGVRGQMKDVSPKTQKRMKEMVEVFMENATSMRKEYLAEKVQKGE